MENTFGVGIDNCLVASCNILSECRKVWVIVVSPESDYSQMAGN